MIDWTDPKDKVSKHFTVKDCLWLAKWNRLAGFDDGLTEELKLVIMSTIAMLECVRGTVDKPVLVHSLFRPKDYAPIVGSKPTSPHCKGAAVDFHVDGLSIEAAKDLIRPRLEDFGACMERGTKTWIHLDIMPPRKNGGREFFP